MFKQFERMLQKQRIAEFEVQVDEIENHTQHYISEFENLKEETSNLKECYSPVWRTRKMGTAALTCESGEFLRMSLMYRPL